jgi:hypothetical protein
MRAHYFRRSTMMASRVYRLATRQPIENRVAIPVQQK